MIRLRRGGKFLGTGFGLTKMANLDRGAYDSDKLHEFDADEMVDDGETSRLPLLVLIALVVLAAFGGVVWLAYMQGVEKGRADTPKIIVAQSHPATPKIAPSPYAGLNIYQPSTPAGSAAKITDAIPPPPAPLAAAHPSNVPPPPAPLVAAHPANSPPVLRPSAAVKQEPPPPVPTVLNSRTAQAAAQKPVTEPAPAPPPKKTEPAQETPPAQPAAATDTTSSEPVVAGGGVLLQIGSYKSQSEAMHSWSAFRARHAIAAGYRPDIQKVTLGAKGTWYRLRLGSFADKKSAIEVCEKLKSNGADCLVAR